MGTYFLVANRGNNNNHNEVKIPRKLAAARGFW
jgi:hypothetical protein